MAVIPVWRRGVERARPRARVSHTIPAPVRPLNLAPTSAGAIRAPRSRLTLFINRENLHEVGRRLILSLVTETWRYLMAATALTQDDEAVTVTEATPARRTASGGGGGPTTAAPPVSPQ